jgi:hypothetical protein
LRCVCGNFKNIKYQKFGIIVKKHKFTVFDINFRKYVFSGIQNNFNYEKAQNRVVSFRLDGHFLSESDFQRQNYNAYTRACENLLT